MANILTRISLLKIFCLLVATSGYSQGRISGPDCVKSGVVYHYLIDLKGKFKNKSQVCITGGFLVDAKESCVSIDSFASIRIIWNEKATDGAIAFNSEKGNAAFNVKITEELFPGEITDQKSQLIDNDTKPEKIICSPATGGNCSPSYNYQWEFSEDAVEWKTMKGENTENLAVTTNIKRPMYYRRKVTEKNSGLVAYSEIVTVLLNTLTL